MNKTQLVLALSARTGLGREAVGAVVDALFDADGLIQEELLAGRAVAIRGFGTFEPQRRRPRVARNPSTGAQIQVPAAWAPAFRPADALRARMRG
ncbi:MAG: HU family DNA-binding protein [Deltaproteobacteria bacterium]|nr:HU family DNA-binding protein [Deltaproteobacteria bacterium]